MSTLIDNIIIVNETEIITTSIDGYFRNLAIVAAFENTDLNEGETFSTNGYEEYESLDAVAVKFPNTHVVYKYAQDAFTQKSNTGVNKSSLEKLTVVQIKTTDTNFEAGLTRVAYTDSYHWACASNVAADIVSFTAYFADKRKIPHGQTSDADVLTDAEGNVAETLADANSKVALYYHSQDDEGLNSAIASIMCYSVPGKIAGFYDQPTGITVDTFSDTEKSALDNNYVNYYTNYIGQAGSYMTRPGTVGGTLSNGDDIQKQVILDRIILNLQSAGMDAVFQKIPYDDRGGTILEGKLKAVLKQLQNEELIAADSQDDEGYVTKGQTLNVLTRAQTKKDFVSYYNQQAFIVQAEVYLALNAKKVVINLAYQV